MKLKLFLILIISSFFLLELHAQSTVTGTVYDIDTQLKLPNVLVRTNKKQLAIAGKSGNFRIQATVNDLLIFTLAGYLPDTLYLVDLTPKKIELTSTTRILDEVKISASPSKTVFNPRKEYPEVYEKSKFALSPSRLLGKDARDARHLKHYFDNEVKQEKIDSIFNEKMISAVIQLKGSELRNFMIRYRPKLSFLNKSSPDQISTYIKNSYKKFLELPIQQRGLPPLN